MKSSVKTPESRATYDIVYNDKTKKLRVTMQYGPPKNYHETIEYSDVPGPVADEFMKASSHGSYFNKFIRSNYAFRYVS